MSQEFAMVRSEAAGTAVYQPGQQLRFSVEQRKIILQVCCGGASEEEAGALIAVAEARGLNPLTQECYFVKRWNNERRAYEWAVQASIDSLRMRAEDTGDYAGQDEPELSFDGEGRLVSATVRVYRKSVPGRPFAVCTARWDEYVQTTKEGRPAKFWAKMPTNQLSKCAEALALRKAFPRALGRLYISEEMGGAAPAESEPEDGGQGHAPTSPKRADARTVDEIKASIDAIKNRRDRHNVITEVMRGGYSPAEMADIRAHLGASDRARAQGSAPAAPPSEPTNDNAHGNEVA